MKFINIQTDKFEKYDRLSQADKAQLLDCIVNYARTSKEPSGDDVSPLVDVFFFPIKNDMEYFDTKYSKRCETNKRIAKERDEARKENERNTNVERTLDNRSLNRKKKIENRKDNKDESLIDKTVSFSDDAQMNEAITLWVAYKKERKETYTQIGLKSFITRLSNLSGGKGDVALKIVEQSMASNYAGVFPLKENQADANKPDVGVILQSSNNKDYSKGGW